MYRALTTILAIQLTVAATQASAEDILLRLQPDASAPVITRIIATEKVLLDAAPAGEDWRKLDLEIPFEGYVPTATLTKSMAIVLDTPVHFLPNANAEVLTQVEEGDLYELVRAKDGWTTVAFKKRMATYFQASAVSSSASPSSAQSFTAEPALQPLPAPPVLDLGRTTPEPKPARPTFDPDAEVGQLAPDELPPENVVWSSAPRRPTAPIHTPEPHTPIITPAPTRSLAPEPIMVGPAETQAREATPSITPAPDKPLRLLTGILVREIASEGPAYPIRLRSPEGRLIAYVDFSGIFIQDLNPFLGQRVYLRGQIRPVRPNDSRLVMFAEEIRLGN